jgi:hypothetical protein
MHMMSLSFSLRFALQRASSSSGGRQSWVRSTYRSSAKYNSSDNNISAPEKLKIYLAKDRSVTSKRDTSLPGRGVKFYLYYLYRLLVRRGSKGTCHSLGRYFIFISPRTSYSAPPTNRHSPSHLTFLPHVTQFTEITFSLGGKFHFASACSTWSSLALLLLRALLIFSELNVGHLNSISFRRVRLLRHNTLVSLSVLFTHFTPATDVCNLLLTCFSHSTCGTAG